MINRFRNAPGAAAMGPSGDRAFIARSFGLFVLSICRGLQFAINKNKALKWLVVACCLFILIGVVARAQFDGISPGSMGVVPPPPDTPASTVPVKTVAISTVVAGIGSVIDQNIAPGGKTASVLRGYSTVLTSFFLVLMMVWTGTKTLMGGKGIGELLAEWVPIWISYLVVNTLLQSDAQQQVVDFFNSISLQISGIDTSTVSKLIQSSLSSVSKTIEVIVRMPSLQGSSSDTGITFGILAMAIDVVVGWLAKFVIMVLVVTSYCFFLGHAIMSQASILIAFLMAPIMVPFLLFPAMDWVFFGWLRFLISACMVKVVGAIILNVNNAMMQSMSDLASTLAADTVGQSGGTFLNDLALMAALILISLLSGLLMKEAPSLAHGLLSGHGGGGFKGFAGITQTTGVQALRFAGSEATARTAGVGVAKLQASLDNKRGVPGGARRYQNVARQVAYATKRASLKPSGSSGSSGGGSKPNGGWSDS